MTTEPNYVLVNQYGERYVIVPVHPATKKYFLVSTQSKDGFVRARLDSLLGLALQIGTEKSTYRRRKIRRKPRGTSINLVLSQNLSHASIMENTLEILGRLLDKTFRNFFFMYVRGAAKTGSSDNYAVNRFLDDFNITEEEWNLDSAKKAYRDYMSTVPGFEQRNSRLQSA